MKGDWKFQLFLDFMKTPGKASEESQGLWGGGGLQVYPITWGSEGALSSGNKS